MTVMHLSDGSAVDNDNFLPIRQWNVATCVPSAFTGGVSNTRGHDGGTSDPFTLFTVTGDVLLAIYGVCTVNLAGASATVAVGTANNAGLLIPATAGTDIDAGEVWVDTTPSVEGIPVDELTYFIIPNGTDIVETIGGSASVTAGNIYYVALWQPITSGAKVKSAV